MIPGAAFAAGALRPEFLASIHPALRLGGLFLGLISCLLVSPPVLLLMTLVLVPALAGTGLGPSAQLKSLRPWLPMILVVLLIHILTTTTAAPLGRPSWGGLRAGLGALLRVGCTVGWLALYSRTSSLDDLVGAVCWWLRPLERMGFSGRNLGLVLAVALGTAPVVLGEGRRIEAVTRLRRAGSPDSADGGSRRDPRRWFRDQLDRARVVVPLVETLGRRAEALSLSLRSRRPGDAGLPGSGPGIPGLAVLALWSAVLIMVVAGKVAGG